MENLIPVINKLQDAFASVGLPGLDLPQIAAGKSSVLENIVGKDFLPRGSGIVTRRPLVLQLIPSSGQEYGVFLHQSDKKYYDFSKIRSEIEAETDRLTGNNKGISNVPINLKVYSPNVLNLTLIDLPGMTRVAVGDQPADIELQIRDMLMEFVEKDTCLILAVSPANTDLANSDALKLAKEVDPDGNRTIGVLTKIDLMDEGTDCLGILQNQVYPLKHSFVGVVNRSQKDINNNKDVKAALESERKWFGTHPVYSVVKDSCGTRYLQEKLKKTLIAHIQHHMPSLRNRLKDRLSSVEQELAILCGHWDGKSKTKFNPETALITEDDKSEKRRQLLNISQLYCSSLKKLLDGHDGDIEHDPFGVLGFVSGISSNSSGKFSLTGSVRIKYMFQDMFPKALSKLETRILSSQMDAELRTIIHNARGLRVGLFIPDALFEIIVKREIALLEKPAVECVNLVTSEICRMVTGLIESKSSPLRAYPKLQSWFSNQTVCIVESFKDPAVEEVKRLIAMECSYINTSHPDFIAKDGITNFIKAYQDGTLALQNPIVSQKEGYLTKLGGTYKTWRKRYFLLKEAVLQFFDSPTDKSPKGVFSLLDCHIFIPSTKEVIPRLSGNLPNDLDCMDEDGYRGKQNVFVIFHSAGSSLFRNHQKLFLSCETESEMQGWISRLKENIDFAKNVASVNNVEEFDDDNDENIAPSTPPSLPPNKPGTGIIRKPAPPPPRPLKPEAQRARPISPIDENMVELPENFSSLHLYNQQTKSSPEKKQSSMTASDDSIISMVRVLLHSYFVIVRKHVQDLVPKAIVHLMISKLKHELLSCLTNKILVNESDGITDDPIKLMEENESIKAEKNAKLNMYRLVKEALKIMDTEISSGLVS